MKFCILDPYYNLLIGIDLGITSHIEVEFYVSITQSKDSWTPGIW
jgi:hypothetical protein